MPLKRLRNLVWLTGYFSLPA